jgi:hypothetical protein
LGYPDSAADLDVVMLIAAYAIQHNAVGVAVYVFQSAPLAIVFIVAGIALAVWGERTFAAAGTEIMPAAATNKKLVTDGPFRFTRNPMYSGLILGISRSCVLFRHAAVFRRARARLPALQFHFHSLRGSEDAAATLRSVHGLSYASQALAMIRKGKRRP